MCPRSPTVESKFKRCKVKKLCCLCASPRHLSADCRGNRREFKHCKICKRGTHYWSLCPDKDKASSPSLSVSSASSDTELLLPLVKVTVSTNGHRYMLICLLDSGNQRFYLSCKVAKWLGIKIDPLPVLQFNMKTFLEKDMQCLKEAPINIAVGDNSLSIKTLFDCNINLNLFITRLDDLTKNLKSAEIKEDGPISIDAFQHMESFQKINFMPGCAWKLSSGILPFGNVFHFLKKLPFSWMCCSNLNARLQL